MVKRERKSEADIEIAIIIGIGWDDKHGFACERDLRCGVESDMHIHTNNFPFQLHLLEEAATFHVGFRKEKQGELKFPGKSTHIFWR